LDGGWFSVVGGFVNGLVMRVPAESGGGPLRTGTPSGAPETAPDGNGGRGAALAVVHDPAVARAIPAGRFAGVLMILPPTEGSTPYRREAAARTSLQ